MSCFGSDERSISLLIRILELSTSLVLLEPGCIRLWMPLQTLVSDLPQISRKSGRQQGMSCFAPKDGGKKDIPGLEFRFALCCYLGLKCLEIFFPNPHPVNLPTRQHGTMGLSSD